MRSSLYTDACFVQTSADALSLRCYALCVNDVKQK